MIAGTQDKQIITDTLEGYINNGFFDNKGPVIFGCTIYARDIRDTLKKNGIETEAFIDNNPDKIGKDCLSLKVYAPQQYLCPYKDDAAVIVCSRYYYEMIRQLNQWGYEENRDIVNIPVSECEIEEKDTRELFDAGFETVDRGYGVYKALQDKYGEECRIMPCPYPGTGDVYMACSLLPHYLQRENINQFVLLVIGESCRRTAALFAIEHIEKITQEEMSSLLKAWEFAGSNRMKVKPLLYWGWRTKKFLYADQYPQITFHEMFQYDVYGFDEKKKEIPPVFCKDKSYAEELFSRLGLKKGQTVILAPYAGSFQSEMGIAAWERLTEGLLQKGYVVCTNCCGDREQPIKGTVPIFFPYEEAVNILEYAGGFIALRSGLCDIVSQAKCKMVIIYENGFNAARYDYFSLKKMGLNKEAFEYVWEDNVLEKTMDIFG